MTTDKQRATSLLQHYLKFGLEAAGGRWSSDNQSEVADIVDSIIDAAGQAVADVILAASSAQPDEPAKPAFRPDWIELPDGGWVRVSEIYLVDIARNGDLIVHLRYRDDGIAICADDPLLDVFLNRLIYAVPPHGTDDSHFGS